MAKRVSPNILHRTVTNASAPARDEAAAPAGNFKKKKIRKQIVNAKTRALIGELLDDPDMTLKEAGKRAGWPNNSAQNAYQALKSPSARELFRREMEKRPGLRHSALAEKLEQGLSATTTKLFAHEGQIIDERELVDFGARATYLTLATKLADLDPASRTELTGAGGAPLIAQQNIVVLPQLSTEQLLALLNVPEPQDVIEAAAVPPPAAAGPEISL